MTSSRRIKVFPKMNCGILLRAAYWALKASVLTTSFMEYSHFSLSFLRISNRTTFSFQKKA